ncbi:MAG: ribosome maturation factor RimP [Deltaproteobacteria bacterium]|nr:ribosome maturation factor RimP [Deltaproteobacteria bacterium]MBW1977052.1 ribosome maturation factor RimP [Deltaproteobacteria bacterium]MBW2045072.1 ribosome maturation factor RimP [Deltaproteobacteria bacterium]MBW2300574.1 ribosome maturation factor RimP [Deltaproteobacteria bacterium]
MVGIADTIRVKVTNLVENILEELGYELVDVEYLTSHGRWVLRLYIDKEGGVTVDDCATVSAEIGDLIDVKDIIPHHYVLEVSSPGLNRPLRKSKDFVGVLGKKIKVKMVSPVEGRRNFVGHLRSFENGILRVETENRVVALRLDDVEKANLIYEFTQ